MIESSDFRTAIEDARFRDNSILSLMYFIETQALGLLRLYLSAAIACASGSVAAFSGTFSLATVALAWSLLASALFFLAGSYFCHRSMKSSEVSLPGREAKFWLWAADPDVTAKGILTAYLENLEQKESSRRVLNAEAAKMLWHAKQFGIGAPISSLVVGVLAVVAGY